MISIPGSLSTSTLLTLVAIPLIAFPLLRGSRSHNRRKRITPNNERVLILGASSVLGRSIAHLYAKRGARVCIVGRRADAVANVYTECVDLAGSQIQENHIIAIEADFTDAESMVNLRSRLASGKPTDVLYIGVWD